MLDSLDALALPRVRLRTSGAVFRSVQLGGWSGAVLDEGRCAPRYGGGKVRKLEWLLGAALEGGGDIVTVGPAGSHHLLATAVHGQSLGLRVHAVAWPQPKTLHAEVNLRALHAHAEVVWPASGPLTAIAVAARAVATVRVLAGYPPAFWGPGGSEPVAVLGWVEAGLEIARALREGTVSAERVIVPSGSGGTAAGLRVGLALGGAAIEVVAVDVTGGGRAVITGHGWGVCRLLREHGVVVGKLGSLRVVPEPSTYGEPTAAGMEAGDLARTAGIAVDPTYGEKALAVALREPGSLFIATGNAQPMEPLLVSALPELPARLARLLR